MMSPMGPMPADGRGPNLCRNQFFRKLSENLDSVFIYFGYGVMECEECAADARTGFLCGIEEHMLLGLRRNCIHLLTYSTAVLRYRAKPELLKGCISGNRSV